MVKKVLLLSNTATLGTNYGYKVVQYMLKMIKPVSTQIHKKVKKSLFFLPNIALRRKKIKGWWDKFFFAEGLWEQSIQAFELVQFEFIHCFITKKKMGSVHDTMNTCNYPAVEVIQLTIRPGLIFNQSYLPLHHKWSFLLFFFFVFTVYVTLSHSKKNKQKNF